MNDNTRKYTDDELAENKLIIIQLFYKNNEIKLLSVKNTHYIRVLKWKIKLKI